MADMHRLQQFLFCVLCVMQEKHATFSKAFKAKARDSKIGSLENIRINTILRLSVIQLTEILSRQQSLKAYLFAVASWRCL